VRYLIVLLFFVLQCPAASVEQVVDYDGCEISGHLRDAAATSFTIRIHDAPLTAKLGAGIKSWWGVDGGIPRRVTSDLALRIGHTEVTIPRRAYADLGNPNLPNSISLMQLHKDIYLYIHGGDAAGSYIAKFFVHDGRLTRREVVPGEFPDLKPQVMTFDQ
jgi:hypothetical protein